MRRLRERGRGRLAKNASYRLTPIISSLPALSRLPIFAQLISGGFQLIKSLNIPISIRVEAFASETASENTGRVKQNSGEFRRIALQSNFKISEYRRIIH